MKKSLRGGDSDHCCVAWDIFDNYGAGTDFYIFMQSNRSQDERVRSDEYAVFYGRVAFAYVVAGSSERASVIENDVVADFCGFSDNDTHAVINKNAFADGCAGMNFHARPVSRDLRKNASEEMPVVFIQLMRESVDDERVKTGVADNRFQFAFCRGVVHKNGV